MGVTLRSTLLIIIGLMMFLWRYIACLRIELILIMRLLAIVVPLCNHVPMSLCPGIKKYLMLLIAKGN